MDTILDVLIKYYLPILATIISIVTLYKGWVFPSDRFFDQRVKISKFVHDLYKISGDKHLKDLSVEYGYSALTRENFLTTEQRRALLSSVDAMSDLENFRKCGSLISINTFPFGFKWVAKRHHYKIYRVFIKFLMLNFYFSGSFLLMLPLTYPIFLPASIFIKYTDYNLADKVGVFVFIILYGAICAGYGLNGLSKMVTAEKLINKYSG